MLLETKRSSAECKEILEDGKGKDSSNAVQNVVNEYASAVTFKQVKNVASTENQVPSSSSTDDMVVGKEIAHGDVKVHTLFQIPVRRSASAVTSEQDVKIAGTVNRVIDCTTHVAKMKVTSTENQLLSSAPTDDMVVKKEISHGDVKVHTPLRIPVSRSASASTSKQGVEIAGTVNHVIGSTTHMTKMKVTSTENQLLNSVPTDGMVFKKEISYGDVKVHTPVQIPVSRSASAATSKQDVEIADTVNRFIDIPTHMTKMKVTSTENQVFSSAPTDDMVIKKEISHGDVKVYTPLQIPVSRSVTSKQGVEIAGAVTHVIGSPTHMAKRVPDCVLVEDTSQYKEVDMRNPVQAQEPLSAVASESAGNVATIEHVFSGPVHVIEIVTKMDKTHVQSVHVDVGMQTDPLSECSLMFDTMTLCMKRKLVEQDHSYCKKKLEPLPKQPECTTNHELKDEAEQNIDSSDDDWEDEISETDIDCDSDEDWVPEDEESDSDDEEFDSDDEDLVF